MDNSSMRRLSAFLVVLAISQSFCFAGGISSAPFPFKKTCIVELATSVNCSYCPVAEKALKELESENDLSDMVIFAHHYKDSLSCYGGNSRMAEYGVNATPIAIFNGQDYYVGGDPNCKDRYRQKISDQLSQTSPFLVHLMGKIEKSKLSLTAWVVAWEYLPPDVNYTFLVGRLDTKTDGRHYPWVTRDVVPKPTGTPIKFSNFSVTRFEATYDLLSIPEDEVFASFVLESFAKKNIFQVASWRPGCLQASSFEPSLGLKLDTSPSSVTISFPTGKKLEKIGKVTFVDSKGKNYQVVPKLDGEKAIFTPSGKLPDGTYLLYIASGKDGLSSGSSILNSPAFLFFKVEEKTTVPDPPEPPPTKPAKLLVEKLGFDLGEIPRKSGRELYFDIKNEGDEKLSGKVAVDCEWLSVEPSTFDNAPATIKCTVDTEKMRPGVDESCIISITSNGGDATIGVKARTHMLPPLLNVEPAELNFGENLDKIITFEVKNLGESVISGTAKSAQSWLSITPEEFGGDTNINVSINKAEIPKFEEPGKHTIEGTIVVETNGGLIEIKVKAIVVVEKQPIVIELMVGTPFAVVDGKTKLLQAPPMIVSGRTLVPLRFVAETFGGQVLWDQATKTTTLKFESKKVEISLRSGEAKATIKDETGVRTVELVPGLTIKSGTSFVPLRFFSEVLGATVEWFAQEKRIRIVYLP